MEKTLIVHTKRCAVTYKLDARARRKLKPIADEFDLSIDEFVTHYACDKLPGQPTKKLEWSADDELAGRLADAIFKANPSAFARIQNASLLIKDSPADFIWKAIGSFVECDEEDMLLSPKTGRPIADRLSFTLGDYCVSRILYSDQSQQRQ